MITHERFRDERVLFLAVEERLVGNAQQKRAWRLDLTGQHRAISEVAFPCFAPVVEQEHLPGERRVHGMENDEIVLPFDALPLLGDELEHPDFAASLRRPGRLGPCAARLRTGDVTL